MFLQSPSVWLICAATLGLLTSATNNLNIGEHRKRKQYEIYWKIRHPWITNYQYCQWHLPFRAKALGTELLALQLSTRFTYFLPFYPLRVSLWFSWSCHAWSCHVDLDDNLFHLVYRACPKVKTSSLHMVTEAGEDSLIFHDVHIFSRF